MIGVKVLGLAVLVSLLVSTVSSATPVCSLPSAQRLAALQTSTNTFASAINNPGGVNYASVAEQTFTTFINHMYDTTNRRLRISYDSTTVSNYWNTAVGMQGLLDYATFHQYHGIPGQGWGEATVVSTVQDLVATQATLSGQCDSALRNGYNDDMSWMVHALTKLWQHNGVQSYLDKATVLFNTIKQSDDTTCCGSHPGGVWWDTAHTSKATAAQAGVTVAALKLMETGHATSYTRAQWLAYAQDHYSFWKTNMVNTGTGQVADHEDTTGAITWWGFTYNNGLMLGAAVHLYNATGTASYLTDAALFASYLLNGQTVTINGASVSILNNDCGGCDGDCSQFHQVPIQYLLDYYYQLYYPIAANKASASQSQIDTLCTVYNFVKNNVDALWALARNTATGKVNCNWNAQFSSGTDGLQGSMNSAMSATSQFASVPIFAN